MGILPTQVLPGEIGTGPPIEDESKLRPPGPKKDVLLVVGDARGALDDIEAFLDLEPPRFDTMAINYAASLIGWPFEHFVAGDSHMIDMQRLAATIKNGCIKHCWNPTSWNFDVRWIRDNNAGWTGTTGNLAVQVGLYLDYLKIVLAGCPMDESGNWYTDSMPDNDVKKKKRHEDHLWKWTEISLRPRAKFIRSMSGNTADLFGTPTKDWLYYSPQGAISPQGAKGDK